MLRSWHRLLPPEQMAGLFSRDLHEHLGEPRRRFESVMKHAPAWCDAMGAAENLTHRALYFEASTFLHGLLVTDDHISMAHSLETRVPFLDNALAELAWTLSPAVKMKMDGLRADGSGSFIDSADGKHVLRRAMERYLPREFVYNRKQGFSPPDENWYRGPSMDYIKSVLLDSQSTTRPWFDARFVAERLNEHFEGRQNHRLLIWSLLSIEWIQRHFADGPAMVPDMSVRSARPTIHVASEISIATTEPSV
jgi:asparagine synthase (glutamine-hydrolysing)